MLFPSTLVISDKLDDVNSLLAKVGHQSIANNPDLLLITDYTVENIRSISNFLSRRPYNHSSKIVLIPQAELLNLESQNTLLKNLEEPGDNNYFIILTLRPRSLISTIISRCHTVRVPLPAIAIPAKITFPQDTKSALKLADTLPKNKDELLSFLRQQLIAYQQELVHHPSPQTIIVINKLTKAIRLVGSNIDPRTVADFLFLS